MLVPGLGAEESGSQDVFVPVLGAEGSTSA